MPIETSPIPELRKGYLRSALVWQFALVGTLMQEQQRQFQVLLTWQKSMAGLGQELSDRLACRFGGGVPLDG